MSEKKEKGEGFELGKGCTGHTYQRVSLRIICHKCGQGMKHDIAKTRCEYCDHSLGMMPRLVEERNRHGGKVPTFEVIV